MKVSALEIENERLRTTIMALNAKATVVDDHRNDAENHYGNHQVSETKRVELHTHITMVATQVHEDNLSHTSYQN